MQEMQARAALSIGLTRGGTQGLPATVLLKGPHWASQVGPRGLGHPPLGHSLSCKLQLWPADCILQRNFCVRLHLVCG